VAHSCKHPVLSSPPHFAAEALVTSPSSAMVWRLSDSEALATTFMDQTGFTELPPLALHAPVACGTRYLVKGSLHGGSENKVHLWPTWVTQVVVFKGRGPSDYSSFWAGNDL
jgi:hypothetical protein